jgi:hypothetical protein
MNADGEIMDAKACEIAVRIFRSSWISKRCPLILCRWDGG